MEALIFFYYNEQSTKKAKKKIKHFYLYLIANSAKKNPL